MPFLSAASPAARAFATLPVASPSMSLSSSSPPPTLRDATARNAAAAMAASALTSCSRTRRLSVAVNRNESSRCSPDAAGAGAGAGTRPPPPPPPPPAILRAMASTAASRAVACSSVREGDREGMSTLSRRLRLTTSPSMVFSRVTSATGVANLSTTTTAGGAASDGGGVDVSPMLAMAALTTPKMPAAPAGLVGVASPPPSEPSFKPSARSSPPSTASAILHPVPLLGRRRQPAGHSPGVTSAAAAAASASASASAAWSPSQVVTDDDDDDDCGGGRVSMKTQYVHTRCERLHNGTRGVVHTPVVLHRRHCNFPASANIQHRHQTASSSARLPAGVYDCCRTQRFVRLSPVGQWRRLAGEREQQLGGGYKLESEGTANERG